jgi:Zn-dependent protease/CBS domain-containing protein
MKMFRRHINLGRIAGIEIDLDYSWFLIFFLVTWILATNYFPLELKGASHIFYWGIAALTAIIFFASVLLHELGHSFLAREYRVRVKRITLFLFGGVAEITEEPPGAWAEFWIALAGPLVSLGLAGGFYYLGEVLHGQAALWVVLSYLTFINFLLALFNLIPGFPLDGGRIFRAFLWGITKNFKKATTIAANTGRFFAYFFIILGLFLIFSGNLLNGLWLAFIGWFLETAAVAQIHKQTLHDTLTTHMVTEAIRKDIPVVPPETSVQELIDHHILGSGRRYFLVSNNHDPSGFLTIHRIKDIPNEKRKSTHVSEIMIPKDDVRRIDYNDDLWNALKEMDNDGVNQLLVIKDNEIIGILSRDSILSFIRNVQELKL